MSTATAIVKWCLDSTPDSPPQGRQLHAHFRYFGHVVPDWLADLIPETSLPVSAEDITQAIWHAMEATR